MKSSLTQTDKEILHKKYNYEEEIKVDEIEAGKGQETTQENQTVTVTQQSTRNSTTI